MMQRKRFFSGDSQQDLPLLSPSASVQRNHSSGNMQQSPPSSSSGGGGGGGGGFDFGRLVPGRASSTSIIRQKAGGPLSLSPQSSSRGIVSSLFLPSHGSETNLVSSHHSSNSSNNSNNNNNSHGNYGMLNPGPMNSNSSSHNNNSSSSSYSKSRSSNSSSHRSTTTTLGWIVSALVASSAVVMTLMVASSYNQNNLLRQELRFKETESMMHLDHSHALERRVSQMRSETVHLYDKLDELEHPKQTQEEINIQRKVFHLETYHDQVNKGIQENSRRVLREKYGPGPNYYVEMKLAFDPESNIVQDATAEISDTILFETASIDHMPHSVELFLEQVSHGLYNGAVFYRNTHDKVQAGFMENPELVEKLEAEPSLGSVLFQEYSPEMRHRQYTLGYPGRPGGPDFYVNMQDNTNLHGPGGQPHPSSDLLVDADPCFGRVIRGFNTMERIYRSNVVEDDDESNNVRRRAQQQHRMVHPILIQSMRVLPSNNE